MNVPLLVWLTIESLFAGIFDVQSARNEGGFSAYASRAASAAAAKLSVIRGQENACYAQATDQTKDLVDLSTRTTQHVFEKVQAAMAASFKPSA
jgi:hypothetical protein